MRHNLYRNPINPMPLYRLVFAGPRNWLLSTNDGARGSLASCLRLGRQLLADHGQQFVVVRVAGGGVVFSSSGSN